MRPNVEAVLKYHGMKDMAEHQYVYVKHPRHIEYDDKGEPLSIICRFCGIPIAGWLDNEVASQQKEKLDNDHTLVKMVIRQRFCRFGNCVQVRMILDSGSIYEPMICRNCAVVGLPGDAAQELYLSDLTEMVAEAMVRGKDPDRAVTLVKGLAERRVRAW